MILPQSPVVKLISLQVRGKMCVWRFVSLPPPPFKLKVAFQATYTADDQNWV